METLESLEPASLCEWDSWRYHQHNLQVSYVWVLVDMLDLVEECMSQRFSTKHGFSDGLLMIIMPVTVINMTRALLIFQVLF